MKIELVNADKLINKLAKLSDGDFSNEITKACLLIENDAKTNCPVNTGALRSSITHSVEGNVGEVGSNLEYAPYVEYGTGLFAENGDGRKDVPWLYRDAKGVVHITSGSHPKPFLRPAYDKNKKEFVELVTDRVREILKNG